MRTRSGRLALLAPVVAAGIAVGTIITAPAAAAELVGSPAGTGTSAVIQPALHRAGTAVPARGGLQVSIDPATLQAAPVGDGTRCLLRVQVTLVFTGTVSGTASGTTSALVEGTCADATSTPPGTFRDAFRFTGNFHGAVAGATVWAAVEYAGVTRVGGQVSALLLLRGDTQVLGAVQAQAGGSGSYRGVVLRP